MLIFLQIIQLNIPILKYLDSPLTQFACIFTSDSICLVLAMLLGSGCFHVNLLIEFVNFIYFHLLIILSFDICKLCDIKKIELFHQTQYKDPSDPLHLTPW